VQNEWSSPSGSRWEPAPQQTVEGVQTLPPPAGGGDGKQVAGPRQRRRRPVAAVLLTLAGAGAVTAGAAYVQGADGPTVAPTSQVAGDGSGRHAYGADGEGRHGDHRGGPRGDGEPPLPSGDPS